MTAYSSFEDIPLFKYSLIMADPPWSFKTHSEKGKSKSADNHYSCMSLDDIKDLSVSNLASKNCLLWLWCTSPLLKEGFETLEAWGFTYKTMGFWSKKTVRGKQSFGTGYILRCAGEPFLIGTIGKPKTTRSTRNVIEGLIREHSQKPDEAFKAAENLIPNCKRLELFSRQEREGWDCFGDEVGKFGDDEIAHTSNSNTQGAQL